MGHIYTKGGAILVAKYKHLIFPVFAGLFVCGLLTGYLLDLGDAIGAPELAVGYVGPNRVWALQKAEDSCQAYEVWAPQVFHALDAEGFRQAFNERAKPEAALPAFQTERDGDLERGDAPWGSAARIGYTRLADRAELTAVRVVYTYAQGEDQRLDALYEAVHTALLALDEKLSAREWTQGLKRMKDFYQRFPVGNWQESFFLGRYRVQLRRDPYPAQHTAQVQIIPRQIREPSPKRTKTPREMTWGSR